jgi:hypothetical protein
MKYFLLFLLTAGLAGAIDHPLFAAPFTYESAAELSTTLDANGDSYPDMVVIDKTTGVRQLALQQSDGSFLWSDPASVGLDNVTALSAGKLSASSPGEGYVVAAPTWNRVLLFPDVNAASLVAPTTGIGPNLAVAFDFAGDALDDLAIATEWDNPPDATHLAELVSSAAGLSLVVPSSPEAGPLTQGNRARFKSDRVWLLGAMRPSSVGQEFVTRFYTPPGSFASGPTLGNLSTNTVWAWGEFNTNGYSQFLFYVPGASALQVPEVDEPTPQQFVWASGQTFDLGQPITQLFVLSETNGAMLLVLFGDSSTGATYDFDGTNPPALRQTFTAPSGMKFSLAGSVGGGDFLLLHGPNGGKAISTGWQRWNWNGSSHILRASGSIPPSTPAKARANILLYGANPDTSPDAPLLQVLDLGEWSISAALSGGVLQVAQETFLGSTAGLGPATQVSVSNAMTSPLGVFPIVNQRSVNEATVLLGPPAGQPIPDLSFSPAPGAYPLPTNSFLQVKIFTPSMATVYFRTDPAQSWSRYNPANPPQIASTTTFSAYADGIPPSPVRTAAYLIANAPPIAVPSSVDANHNGLPDSWEQAFGITDPNGDADGDGFTNLQEYLAGTDPLDPNSVPGSPPKDVTLAALSPDPGAPAGTLCQIVWSSSLTGAALEATSDLGNPAGWAGVAGPFITRGDSLIYYQPAEQNVFRRFYRLHLAP